MINIDGYRILTDPVFEKRISIFGPTRYTGDLPIRTDRLPRIDAVIISHDHYDHLNKWRVQQLAAACGGITSAKSLLIMASLLAAGGFYLRIGFSRAAYSTGLRKCHIQTRSTGNIRH